MLQEVFTDEKNIKSHLEAALSAIQKAIDIIVSTERA